MDDRGYFNQFGGAYLPEILVATFDELERTFVDARNDPNFWQEYADIMGSYSCRPTPLTFAPNLTAHFGGAKIYIKREDLNHTGAHKANNVMGQGLLVQRMGKKRVIAETGWPPPPWRPGSVSSAPFTWARWMWTASGPTCSGWNVWAPGFTRSRTAPAFSKTP